MQKMTRTFCAQNVLKIAKKPCGFDYFGSKGLANGGLYWARTSDLLHVKETRYQLRQETLSLFMGPSLVLVKSNQRVMRALRAFYRKKLRTFAKFSAFHWARLRP